MADPKKPDAPPEENKVKPEDMTYPTPELDPATGAPIDTRFQGDNRQEAAASQPSPKSETKNKAPEPEYDEGGPDEKKTSSKGKTKR